MIELSDKSSPLNIMTIYPKCDRTLYSVSITENKIALWLSPLSWAHFVFLFLLFQVPELDHHHMSTPPSWTSFHVAISIHECHLAPSLGLNQPISNPHLEHKVSPNRFHQFSKIKLGLLARPRPSAGAAGSYQVVPPSSAASWLEPTIPWSALRRPKEEGQTKHVLRVCFKCFRCSIGMLQVFHIGNACTRMLQASHVSSVFSDICCKCVYLDVAYVSHICCKCFI